jgi:hypothetical protein
MAGRRETLLVNHLYAHPVGHAVEALRVCLGYHRPNPELEIHLLLNAATAWELAELCPFVHAVHTVEVDLVREEPVDLSHVPAEWDWIVDEHRLHQDFQLEAFPGLRRYREVSDRRLRAGLGHGVVGDGTLPYEPHGRLLLELPPAAEQVAPALAVLPAGSGVPEQYPSVSSWELILGALAREFSEHRLVLVGKLRRDERTSTRIAGGDLVRLLAAVPCTVDAFDRPLLEQLALVRDCDLLLAPHSGFGMAALAVGTPWLALSGGRWFEWFFNGVPFASALPDTARYPAFPDWGEPLPLVDEDGVARTPSMSRERIEADLPELLAAARELVEGRFDYEEALDRYFPRLVAALGGERERVFSFEAVHRAYV